MQHLREDQSLLVWRNPLLVLDFLLYVFNGVRSFDIEGNRFTCKSLDENLHGGWVNVKWWLWSCYFFHVIFFRFMNACTSSITMGSRSTLF